MGKHTPWPWTIKRSSMPVDGEYNYAISAIFDGRPMVIAGMYGRVAATIRPDAEANARLISAASDLLAALKRSQPFMDHRSHCPVQDGSRKCNCGFAEVDRLVDSAIAKATGAE